MKKQPLPVIVSFSGGKDSTAMLLKMLEMGEHIDEVVFIDSGMEWPAVYEHIAKLEANLGLTITKLKPEKSWDYWFSEHLKRSGKTAGTRGYEWPTAHLRWCTRFLKEEPMRKYLFAKYGRRCCQCIGIAADETKRFKHKRVIDRHPLVEYGMTEAQCLDYCLSKGYDFGGLYNHFARISCFCCPLNRIGDARNTWKYYPEQWKRIVELDDRCQFMKWKVYGARALEERFKQEEIAAQNTRKDCR